MKSPNSMNKSQEWRFSNLNSTFNKSEKNINNLEGNKKNFLLDYVFKSDKLSALKKSDKKPKIGESYTKTETSYNSKFAKSSKIAEKFEGKIERSRTQKNLNFLSTDGNSDKISIKSKILQKLSNKDKPGNIKFPIVNTSNLNYQFFDLASKIRENKFKQSKENSSSLRINDSNEKLTNNLTNSYTIKSRPAEDQSNSINISNIKNIVLNSSRTNKNEKITSNDITKNKDNINFYQVNIGKYMNISKESPQSFKDNACNSVTSLNSFASPSSNKKGNYNVRHNLLKPSFTRLINMENVESPEELHFTSVLFNLEKNKLARKFDRSSSGKFCYQNESYSVFLIEETDI